VEKKICSVISTGELEESEYLENTVTGDEISIFQHDKKHEN
jgi:hypothetical protein